MTAPINYNSRSFFHYPSPRPTLKLSAKNQLEKLIKHRAFTEREKQILLALNDVGLLTRHQIQRMFFPSVDTARRKLKAMYDNHLLDSGSDDWFQHTKDHIDYTGKTICIKGTDVPDFGLLKSFIYSPSLVGRLVISLENFQSIDEINFDTNRYNALYLNRLTLHDLWISEAYVQIRLAAEAKGYEFSWMNEANSIIFDDENPDTDIVRPDASCSVRFDGGEDITQHDWYIEMDRGSTQWDKKLAQYWEALQRGDWQKHGYDLFPVVLCVVPERQLEKAKAKMLTTLGSIWRSITESNNAPHFVEQNKALFQNQFDFSVTSWSQFLADPIGSWYSLKRKETYSIFPSN